jgi:hypothetical protein
MWHYPMCRHYPICCHVFLPWNCLHYTLWSLDTHILLIWSPIPKKISAINWVPHFLHIYHLDFYLKKIYSCLQALRRFLGVTSFKVPPVKMILSTNQDDLCFLWDLGLWILTTRPFHSYTLAYCGHIYLISIEFQNIDNNPSNPPKNFFFLFNRYNLIICVVTLSEIFFTN